MAQSENIANDCEGPSDLSKRAMLRGGRPDLFLMQASSEFAYVWASSFESAFEEFVEYLDDQKLCGVFTTIDEDDMKDAANSLGLAWNPDWISNPDPYDGDFNKVREYAEIDLTIIGHTSLRNCEQALGGGPLYIPSFEWSGYEISDEEEYEEVARLSMKKCWGHSAMVGDLVIYRPEGLPEDHGIYQVEVVNGDDISIEDGNGEGYVNISKDEEGLNLSPSEKELEEFGNELHVAKASEPPPRPAPAMMRQAYPKSPQEKDDDRVEKKRLADFFFPKSTLPKSRPGGGGFMGLKKKR